MPESEELKNQQETNAARVPVAAGAVFVSHASEDAAIAKSLVTALEQQGLTCWIAPRDVAPGSLYADQIIGAINKAKVVALILSKDALASPHVSREIERASSKRRPIITLRADPSELTPAFEYFLSESQWIDVAAEGRHKAFGKAVTAIRQHVEGAAEAETFRAAVGPLQQPSAINRLRWPLLIATVLLVGFALAWIAINKSRAVKFQAPLKLSAAQERRIANSADTAPFTPPAHSIAVLPFINMSGDPKQDYFSDGISEELLNSLSRLDGLLVVARTSSFRFKGTDTDVSTIARKLNVGIVLEGSVRRAGNTVRITVQLINAVSGFHLWSEEYDRKLTDILKIQSEVARAVARQLSGQLTAEDVKKLEQGGTANQPAYEANLRGVRITPWRNSIAQSLWIRIMRRPMWAAPSNCWTSRISRRWKQAGPFCARTL
jgi:TolB-like protein